MQIVIYLYQNIWYQCYWRNNKLNLTSHYSNFSWSFTNSYTCLWAILIITTTTAEYTIAILLKLASIYVPFSITMWHPKYLYHLIRLNFTTGRSLPSLNPQDTLGMDMQPFHLFMYSAKFSFQKARASDSLWLPYLWTCNFFFCQTRGKFDHSLGGHWDHNWGLGNLPWEHKQWGTVLGQCRGLAGTLHRWGTLLQGLPEAGVGSGVGEGEHWPYPTYQSGVEKGASDLFPWDCVWVCCH